MNIQHMSARYERKSRTLPSNLATAFLLATFAAAVAIVLSLAATPVLAQSCTDNWIGGGGNSDWSNGANWSTGMEPGSNDTACIATSGAAVSLDVNDGIANLALGSSDSLTLPTVTNASPSLGISGSSIANSGQIILSAPVSFGTTDLSLSSTGTVTLSGSGTITLQADTLYGNGNSIGGAGTLLNQSTIQGAGSIDMTINNSKKGVVNANQSGFQMVLGRNQAHDSTNTGLLEATNGGQLAMGSLTLNNVGGTIMASGKNSYVQIEGEGQGGETFTGGTWTTANGGVIQVFDPAALLDGTNGNTITNSGTMQLIVGRGGNFQGTVNNTGSIAILSSSTASTNLGIPAGQTFTLMGTGNLTMGDGTDNAYNNSNSITGGGTFVNQQLVQGTGTIQNLTSFSNSGTIDANVSTGPNNLQLVLGRAGASTNTGTIEATNGGVLVIGSTTIDNVGGTIAASGTGSNVSLVGSLGTSGLTITGGTFDGSGGGVVYGQGGSLLDGTTSTVDNTGTMIINNQGLQVQGTLNNTGTMQILAPTNDNGQTFLQIPNGENLTVTGTGSIIMGDGTNNSYNNNPAIGNNFGTNGTFDNRSTIEGTGGIVLTNEVINDGTIIANVPTGTNGLTLLVDRVGNIQNSGTIHATKGGVFYIGGGSCCGNPFTNAGTVIADANSTVNLENANPFGNLANGVLTGGTYNVTGTLEIPGDIATNAAKIALTGTASQILNPSTNALAGFVTNASKGSFTLAGDQSFTAAGTFTNKGAITISKGSTFTVGEGGSYVQSGGTTTVDGELTISSTEDSRDDSESGVDPASAATVKISKGSLFGNGGNIAAAVSSSGTVTASDSSTSVGKLTVTGAYTQTSAGALDANIAGAESGQFNLLNVTGTATLGGTLNIKLLKSFVPLVGATFEILTAKEVKGTFATVNGTAINSSEHFTVTYNSKNVTLTVVSGT
jgi:hypothetical protein